MKILSILALTLSLAAIILAFKHRPPIATQAGQDETEALKAQIATLQKRVDTLEATGSVPRALTVVSSGLEQQVETLASNQQDIAELALGLDPLGVIEKREREILKSYEILTDVTRPAWERAKQAALLKKYDLFDGAAFSSMWRLFSEPKSGEDQAAALLALKGRLGAEHRDEVLAALQSNQDESKDNSRLRYFSIEALEPLLPDPLVEDWLLQSALNDPQSKIARRAAKSLGLPDPKLKDKGR